MTEAISIDLNCNDMIKLNALRLVILQVAYRFIAYRKMVNRGDMPMKAVDYIFELRKLNKIVSNESKQSINKLTPEKLALVSRSKTK